mgnify:FL=1
MKLYLLRRKRNGMLGYDEAHGMVVRARSASRARAIASENAGDEGATTWKDAERSSCSYLIPEGREGLVLLDFNAG